MDKIGRITMRIIATRVLECQRCDSTLVDGLCSDETCPFSDVSQNHPRGWAGHQDPPSSVDRSKVCKHED